MSPSEDSKGIDTRERGSEKEIALPKSWLYPDRSDATVRQTLLGWECPGQTDGADDYNT